MSSRKIGGEASIAGRTATILEQISRGRGITFRELAELLEISPSAVSQQLHGRSKKPGPRTLRALQRQFAVNPNWILTGEGNRWLTPEQETQQWADALGLVTDAPLRLGSRLKFLREILMMDAAAMAELVGTTPGAWEAIEEDRRTPTVRHLHALCLKRKVNLNWLVTGAGSLFNENGSPAVRRTTSPKEDDNFLQATGRMISAMQRRIDTLEREVRTVKKKKGDA